MLKKSLKEYKKEFDNLPIEAIEQVLWEMAVEEFESWEAAPSLRTDIRNCKSKKQLDVLNKFFIGIFGWGFDTLLERAKAVDPSSFDEY